MTKWIVVIGLFIIILIGAVLLVVIPAPNTANAPTTVPSSFAGCAQYFPVTQSYPRTCTTNLGQTFTEDIGNTIAMQDLVVVNTPNPGDSISSPVSIVGRARGTYFFEGVFPVEIHDSSGNVLGHGQAEATQPWTTANFINFKATVAFSAPSFGSTGILVLKNDNPSGKPENQKELDIPIVFK